MKQERELLLKKVTEFTEKYENLDENLAGMILSEDKWSLKQIMGHLMDSALNNHQRFIRLQEADMLTFPGYTLNWIELEHYNDLSFSFIMGMWKQFNLFLAHIIGTINLQALDHVWQKDGDRLTLSFLVTDYIHHMDLHFIHFEERLEELNAVL